MARNRVVLAAAVAAVVIAVAGGGYLLRGPLGLGDRPAAVPPAPTATQPIGVAPGMPVPQPVAEQFDKWRVQCVQDAQSRQLCRAEQVIAGAGGVPQLAIFVTAAADGRPAQAIVVPPWGVMVDRGLTLQVDAQPRFNAPIISCQPSGCWSEFPINETLLGQLRKGSALQVAMIGGDGAPIVIAVPLAGLAAGYERLVQKAAR